MSGPATSRAKRTSAVAPSGVAWPTVSQRQSRRAPASMALRKSLSRSSGLLRVVSSVTYVTWSPCFSANAIASTDCFSMNERSHSSAYCRIGELPMKA